MPYHGTSIRLFHQHASPRKQLSHFGGCDNFRACKTAVEGIRVPHAALRSYINPRALATWEGIIGVPPLLFVARLSKTCSSSAFPPTPHLPRGKHPPLVGLRFVVRFFLCFLFLFASHTTQTHTKTYTSTNITRADYR